MSCISAHKNSNRNESGLATITVVSTKFPSSPIRSYCIFMQLEAIELMAMQTIVLPVAAKTAYLSLQSRMEYDILQCGILI